MVETRQFPTIHISKEGYNPMYSVLFFHSETFLWQIDDK